MLTNKQKIILLCDQINKTGAAGSLYTIDGKNQNLKINRWSTGIADLDSIIGGGMPKGRVVEIFGQEACVSGSAIVEVSHCVSGGVRGNRKMDLHKLFMQFNDLEQGDGRNDRFCGMRKDFSIISVEENTGRVISQKIADVVECGVKMVFEVRCKGGHKIRCTNDHKFRTGDGQYNALSSLSPGDFVYIHDHKGMSFLEKELTAVKINRVVVRFYPCRKHRVMHTTKNKDNGESQKCFRYSVPLCKLVYEAELNNLSFDDFVSVLNTWEKDDIIERLNFVDFDLYDIHHIDFDETNDQLQNLQLLTKSEYEKLHVIVKKLPFMSHKSEIVSIDPCWEEMTYDVKCFEPNNNYVADNFVVHNSGKTTLLYHLFSRHDLCLDIPIEGTFDSQRAKIFGNKKNQLLVYRAEYGEDAFNKVLQFARLSIPMIGIDSVPSLIPKDDIEKVFKASNNNTIEEQRIGGVARLITKHLPPIEKVLEVSDTTLVFINQVRDKMQAMMFGEKTDTPGGHKLKHACSLRIQVARKAWIEIPNKNPCNSSDKEKIGLILKCKVIKSKVCNPMGECEIPLIFEKGFVSFTDLPEIRKRIMDQRKEQFNKKANHVID